MNRRNFAKACAGAAVIAATNPTTLLPQVPEWREVEAMVDFEWTKWTFESLKQGQVFRFVDEPWRWLRALSDPAADTTSVPGLEGNYGIQCEVLHTGKLINHDGI